MNIPRRGELWLADLSPASSKPDQAGPGRPCLVVQTDLLNDAGHPTTVVIPGTSRACPDSFGDAFPLRVPIVRTSKEGRLTRETDLLIDQICAIPMRSLLGKSPIVILTLRQLQRVQEALQLVLML